MTTRILIAVVGIAPLMLVNCGGGASGPAPSTQTIGERPGARDVQVGADTLPVIPRDEVQKSQSGAVFQRVANTDIEVVYDRPVARGRDEHSGLGRRVVLLDTTIGHFHPVDAVVQSCLLYTSPSPRD